VPFYVEVLLILTHGLLSLGLETKFLESAKEKGSTKDAIFTKRIK
jgi:hypothetical protein